jgi:hypothetical protein
MQRFQIGERRGSVGRTHPLLELLGREPARDRVLVQFLDHPLAVAVACAQFRPIAHISRLDLYAVIGNLTPI